MTLSRDAESAQGLQMGEKGLPLGLCAPLSRIDLGIWMGSGVTGSQPWLFNCRECPRASGLWASTSLFIR